MLIELPRWLADQAPAVVGIPMMAAICLLALHTKRHAHDGRGKRARRRAELPAE